jgi:hypothetical protein
MIYDRGPSMGERILIAVMFFLGVICRVVAMIEYFSGEKISSGLGSVLWFMLPILTISYVGVVIMLTLAGCMFFFAYLFDLDKRKYLYPLLLSWGVTLTAAVIWKHDLEQALIVFAITVPIIPIYHALRRPYNAEYLIFAFGMVFAAHAVGTLRIDLSGETLGEFLSFPNFYFGGKAMILDTICFALEVLIIALYYVDDTKEYIKSKRWEDVRCKLNSNQLFERTR